MIVTKGAAALVIWRFRDGKAGHDNQSLGLCRALAARVAVQVYSYIAPSRWLSAWQLLIGRYPRPEDARVPHLLLGAGHATHLAMLAARRAHGGRAVVLMRPSLPMRCFDLALVPEHDSPPATPTVIATLGVLNTVKPGHQPAPGQGLILLGGPSKHFAWSSVRVIEQVKRILAGDPRQLWTVADSRRTPPECAAMLVDELEGQTQFVSHDSVAPDWLRNQLASAREVWVTEDSVSMVYESLSAGAPTGLIAVDRRAANRVSRGVDNLIALGLVTPIADWTPGQQPVTCKAPLDEAGRCAELLLERWPELTSR